MADNENCKASDLSAEQIKKFQQDMDRAIAQVAIQAMEQLKKDTEEKKGFGFFSVFRSSKDKQYAA